MDLLLFIGAIAAFIILHELGHYLASLVCGVEVEEFGLGFPPRILTLFNWRGTEFTLNWIPLGGFVRPKGENDPDVPGGLASASPLVRFAVMVSGPMMNILVAALLYSMTISQIGMPEVDKVMVMEVVADSPAASAGLQANDLLKEINGETLDNISEVQSLVAQNKGKEINLGYERDGKMYHTKLTPRLNPPPGQGAIGIAMSNPTRPISLLAALPLGGKAVFDQGYLLFTLPMRFMEGAISSEEMRVVGFKGMYDIYQGVREVETAQPRTRGVGTLAFFAMISASLGILNLLPIPALDGGRILFLLPELLIRKRVPARFENALHMVGFMLLLALLMYVNIQDFVNPVELGNQLPNVTMTPTP